MPISRQHPAAVSGRRTRPSLFACAAILALACFGEGSAQGFGKNKVQYDTFDWQVLVTDHLEIHFYPEEEELARRTAEYGEEACAQLEEALGHSLTKKIPLIVYKSHYHFRQNNVSASLVGESTGGFTEIFRKRVVLPYSGSEPKFRHVIHHELVHAYVFDMLYGGPVRSLFVLQYAFYIPLWFMEGIAEYYSNLWDSEGEMMLRDAAVHGQLPPFHQIHGGYFVYKSGWSAVGYLVERHGEDVIRRILEKLEETRRLPEAILEVTGEDVAKIGGEWLKDVRRRTWPTFAYLKEPSELGKVLTPSFGTDGSLNSHAELSPGGERIVFLSNRSGTPDLYVMHLDDGTPARVLVRGARGAKFESLHPLRSSVGWSPDGRFLVAAAQRGARDALYVLDSETGRVVSELTPPLDALERPDWSPAEARIVFTGMLDGQVDLYAIDADGENFEQLTDDLHEERGAQWSPDGKRIAFSSDRMEETGLDLWTLKVETGDTFPVRLVDGDQWDPAWSADGDSLFHVSDEHGTRDLMKVGARGGIARRLSCLIGGVDSPSTARGGGRLAFTAYHQGSWKLVLVEDADTLGTVEAPDVEMEPIPWKDAPTDSVPLPDVIAVADPEPSPVVPQLRDYAPRFRTEWITGSVGYSTLGASGSIQAQVSDVLGNHRLFLGTRIFRTFEDSDVFLSYSYLPRRFDYGLSLFHVKDFLYNRRTTLGHPIGEEAERAFFSERSWGLLGSISYPFHTFRRAGLDVTVVRQERVRYSDESRQLGSSLQAVARSTSRVIIPRIHHTFDNTLWGWTGPIQGSRSVFSFQHSIPFGGRPLSYGTVLADVRHYSRFGEYVLALRGMAASSFGDDPQVFLFGGPNTIRGYPLQEFRGRNAALASIEFRYPFLEYVKLGWPFRSAFGGIRGSLFLDAGSVFDRPAGYRLSGPRPEGHRGLEDLKIGFGVGFRARLAYLPMRLDVGWPTDLGRVGSPHWHFSIGPEY